MKVRLRSGGDSGLCLRKKAPGVIRCTRFPSLRDTTISENFGGGQGGHDDASEHSMQHPQ